jgi:hypothetical protein
MDPGTRRLDALAALLEQSQMPQAEVARRVALATDAEYWKRIAPWLSIGADEVPPARPLADADLREAIAQFQDDGYFQTPPLLAESDLAAINRAIDAVVAEGWPPVFAWVYDALWHCARLPAVARLLASHLGARYAQIPHVWVHVVPAAAGAAGWMPHFDGSGRGRASVWVALTAATLDNGCMHLVPRRSLAAVFSAQPVTGAAVAMSDALRTLHAVRALPTPPGGVLGWDFAILHWGGRCVKPGEARRALSMEFLAQGETPDAYEVPLVTVEGPLPALADRLRMIGEAVHTYEKFEAGLVRYRGIADILRKP